MDDRDRLELHELPGRYGDLIDARDWPGLANIFTDDAQFVVNGKVLNGLLEIQTYMAASKGHPLTHLMANIYVDETSAGVVLHSRIIAMHPNGSMSSGRYRDVVVKRSDGWRVNSRSFTSTPRSADAPW
jgi:uncharacterized protein (TIGR02246 family)